ncbi:hypothetical protein PMKS-003588 [Pichia membranifaciens]|uniref:Uncharacterized protein n=1 Tax=Pichia membranifaciens TaxID=4926 RepID=A0A1Q2YKL7_9ASCO|nr:hypothetical protein PMKS-003588 [Pichia membranifaciens]
MNSTANSDDTGDMIHHDFRQHKEPDHDTDSEQDSTKEVEEFSSFDISDDDLSRSAHGSDQHEEVSPDIFENYETDDERANLVTADADSAMNSAPRTPKPSARQSNSKPICELHSNLNAVDEDTKPSSRLSSDTFETPKTVETRASTMTSNPPSDYKLMGYELSLPSATLAKQSKSKELTKNKRGNGRTSSKRLSRQTIDDISMDRDSDYNSSAVLQSMDSLFAKLSLDDHSHSSNLVPSANDLVDLQNQLTNCKIQIKLQNDLLRDKIYQSVGDGENKQELSEELERKIYNSLNSSKLRFQLNHANIEYNSLKEKYEKLLLTIKDLSKSVELLRDQHADMTHNQHEWQGKINSLISRIETTLDLEKPARITDFNDILKTLSIHIETMLDELIQSRVAVNGYEDHTNKLLETIKAREQELDSIQNDFTKKLQDSEHLNFNYKSKIFDYENLLKTEKSNYSALEAQYSNLQSQYHDLEKEISNKREEVNLESTNQAAQLESQVNNLKKANSALKRSQEGNATKMGQIVRKVSSHHSALLNSLMRIIDPSSSGNVISACNKLNGDTEYEQIVKVFSVAHNYEVSSLNTILENYQVLVSERRAHNLQSKTISELQGEILFLTQKINDLETMKDSETIRIHELQTQNTKLKEIVNEKANKTDQLKKLRLEDLKKKWKAAEEALSQTKQGAQMKISELEEELNATKTQLSQFERT